MVVDSGELLNGLFELFLNQQRRGNQSKVTKA